MGQDWSLFIYVLFKLKFHRKSCRLQQDSNLDHHSRRQSRKLTTRPTQHFFNHLKYFCLMLPTCNPHQISCIKYILGFRSEPRAWSSLVAGDEQLDWPNSQAYTELYSVCIAYFVCICHNTTAFHLGRYYLHLLPLKSSMFRYKNLWRALVSSVDDIVTSLEGHWLLVGLAKAVVHHRRKAA